MLRWVHHLGFIKGDNWIPLPTLNIIYMLLGQTLPLARKISFLTKSRPYISVQDNKIV